MKKFTIEFVFILVVISLVGCSKSNDYDLFLNEFNETNIENITLGSSLYNQIPNSNIFSDISLSPKIIDDVNLDDKQKIEFKEELLKINTSCKESIKEKLENSDKKETTEKTNGKIVFRIELLQENGSTFFTCSENNICTIQTTKKLINYTVDDVNEFGIIYENLYKDQEELLYKYFDFYK